MFQLIAVCLMNWTQTWNCKLQEACSWYSVLLYSLFQSLQLHILSYLGKRTSTSMYCVWVEDINSISYISFFLSVNLYNIRFCVERKPQKTRDFACGLSLFSWMDHLGLLLLLSLLGFFSLLCMLYGLSMLIPCRFSALYLTSYLSNWKGELF